MTRVHAEPGSMKPSAYAHFEHKGKTLKLKAEELAYGMRHEGAVPELVEALEAVTAAVVKAQGILADAKRAKTESTQAEREARRREREVEAEARKAANEAKKAAAASAPKPTGKVKTGGEPQGKLVPSPGAGRPLHEAQDPPEEPSFPSLETV